MGPPSGTRVRLESFPGERRPHERAHRTIRIRPIRRQHIAANDRALSLGFPFGYAILARRRETRTVYRKRESGQRVRGTEAEQRLED